MVNRTLEDLMAEYVFSEPVKSKVYYERLETTDGKFVFDTSKPLDSEGKPLANPEIVDGIAQREVNKAKGV